MVQGFVQVVTADHVTRQLVGLGRGVAPRDLPRILGRIGVNDIRRGIREQRTPSGQPYRKTYRFGRPAQRLRDTNRMMGAITFVTKGSKLVTIGVKSIQAATQHYGDENRRAKDGGYIAIPQSREIAARYTGSFKQMFPDAFVIRLAGKFGAPRLYLVRKLEKGVRASGSYRITRKDAGDVRGKKGTNLSGARLQFIALLVKRVRIPATPFMGISQRGETEMRRVAEIEIQHVVTGGDA